MKPKPTLENIQKVLLRIREEEKHFKRTEEDIKTCYTDTYILSVWESEGMYLEETGEGWNSFEDFLTDFILQNIEAEEN